MLRTRLGHTLQNYSSELSALCTNLICTPLDEVLSESVVSNFSLPFVVSSACCNPQSGSQKSLNNFGRFS
jgi:hypothetical protein